LPAQQGVTPQAITGSLKNLPPQRLLAMYNDPQNTTPKLAVAAAYAQAIEQARLMQAASGQSAIAQNQAQDQQPPVAQQIMSQPMPQMAANGGMMQGYAGGGAVAFADGTDEEGVPDLSDDPSLSFSERLRRRQKRAELSRQEGIGKSFAERFPSPAESTTDTGDELARMLRRTPAPEYGNEAMRQSRQVPTAPARGVMALPGASSASARVSQTQKSFAPDYESQIRDLERSSGNVQSAIRTGAQPGEAVTAGRSDLRTQMLANLAAQQKEAQDYRDEITKRRDERLAQTARPIWENPEALLRIAGGMNLERGKGIGSLASAAGSELGAQRKAAEEAKDRFMADQRDARQLDAANRAYQLAIAEKQQAYAEGDDQAKRAADIKVAETQQNLAKTKIDISEKREQLGIQRLSAQASMASANKPTPYEQFKRDPQGYTAFLAAQQEKRNPWDVINDNIRAEYKDWLQSIEGMTSTPEVKAAKQEKIRREMMAEARAMGVNVPEAAMRQVPTGGKIMTMADVQATAASSGRTVDEVKKAAMAKGYVIQ
jgi:hypothetical protein